jgi:hypothetical protein
MHDKPIAYTGLFLVLAGFLSILGVLALGDSAEWLRRSREGIAWAAFAMCIVGGTFGLINWRTAPGKVAACFGGAIVVVLLAFLLYCSPRPDREQPPPPPAHKAAPPLGVR